MAISYIDQARTQAIALYNQCFTCMAVIFQSKYLCRHVSRLQCICGSSGNLGRAHCGSSSDRDCLVATESNTQCCVIASTCLSFRSLVCSRNFRFIQLNSSRNMKSGVVIYLGYIAFLVSGE